MVLFLDGSKLFFYSGEIERNEKKNRGKYFSIKISRIQKMLGNDSYNKNTLDTYFAIKIHWKCYLL